MDYEYRFKVKHELICITK